METPWPLINKLLCGGLGQGDLAFRQAIQDAQQGANRMAAFEPIDRLARFGQGLTGVGGMLGSVQTQTGPAAPQQSPLAGALQAGASQEDFQRRRAAAAARAHGARGGRKGGRGTKRARTHDGDDQGQQQQGKRDVGSQQQHRDRRADRQQQTRCVDRGGAGGVMKWRSTQPIHPVAVSPGAEERFHDLGADLRRCDRTTMHPKGGVVRRLSLIHI